MRLSKKKIDPNLIDWDEIGVNDDEKIEQLKQILVEPIPLRDKFLKLIEAGLRQKQIAKIYGVSESTISLRVSGKVGKYDITDVLGNYPDQLPAVLNKIRRRMPRSDYLIELLQLHGLSSKKISKILYHYSASPDIYDNRIGLRRLLKAFRTSDEKCDLIINQFYEFETPTAGNEHLEPPYASYGAYGFYTDNLNYYRRVK